MNRTKTRRRDDETARTRSWALGFLAVVAVACGGTGSGPDATGNGGSGGATPSGAPLYAICGLTLTPDGRSGYLALVSDLEAGTTFDLADTLEFPGGSLCAAPGNSNRLYVGIAERAVIQRYSVGEGDTFRLDEELGLSGLGITAPIGRNPLQFLSDTRAYFIDGSTLQVVVWNPDSMVIDSAFDIGGLRAGDLQIDVNEVVRDGDRFIMSVRYFRADDSAELLVRAVFIDSTDDSVTYAEDTRCGNIAWTAVAENGDIYFASHPAQATRARTGLAGNPASTPCLLRILAGTSEFDPSFFVELNDLTGGQPTGSILAGRGSTAYVMAYDEEQVPISDDNAGVLTIIPAWRYWALDLEGDFTSASVVTAVPAGPVFAAGFTVDRPSGPTPYIVGVRNDLSSGTLFDISDAGGFVEAITVPGFPVLALRIR
ncbi:MAG: hypothetical protein AAF997_17925 [Myxococcota bacterium]